MNTRQITTILKDICPEIFLGVYAADALPNKLPKRRPLLLVVNTDTSDQPGQHWVSMFIDKQDKGEYFDPVGMQPLPIFDKFLTKFCSTYVYNNSQLQSSISYVCGHYAIVYAVIKCKYMYSLQHIIDVFTTDTYLNDMIAHSLFHVVEYLINL